MASPPVSRPRRAQPRLAHAAGLFERRSRCQRRKKRLATDRLAFREHPAGPMRRVIDFYRFHHEQVAERIESYARA